VLGDSAANVGFEVGCGEISIETPNASLVLGTKLMPSG
jgi:hypothetical protein